MGLWGFKVLTFLAALFFAAAAAAEKTYAAVASCESALESVQYQMAHYEIDLGGTSDGGLGEIVGENKKPKPPAKTPDQSPNERRDQPLNVPTPTPDLIPVVPERKPALPRQPVQRRKVIPKKPN